MKTILSALLFIAIQTITIAQSATLDFINKTTIGNDITFEVILKPNNGTIIYLGNFDITVSLPSGTVSGAERVTRASILSEDNTSVPILTSITSDGSKINFQPNTPGNQADFNAILAKITTQVSLGTYRITFTNPPSGTVTCGGGSFFTLAPISPWVSSNVPTECSSVLPLDLIDFSAKAMRESGKNVAHIKWQTAYEKEVNYFEVEKSGTNGKAFSVINKVNARNGNAEHYEWVDESPYLNVNYYRLKMVDNDGTIQYSAIKSVLFKDTKATSFKVYPNPAVNSLTIDYTFDAQKETNYSVINTLGQTLMQGKLTGADLDISSLPSGTFVIKVGEGQLKFLKL